MTFYDEIITIITIPKIYCIMTGQILQSVKHGQRGMSNSIFLVITINYYYFGNLKLLYEVEFCLFKKVNQSSIKN